MIYEEYGNHYEELKSYYPLFYETVYEMQEILKAHGKALDVAIFSANRVLANQFVDSMETSMLDRMIHFFNLEGVYDSDESKKMVLKSHMAGIGKISEESIREMVNIYLDTDESYCLFQPGDEYLNNKLTVYIEKHFTGIYEIDLLLRDLKKRLPAHIWFGLHITSRKGIGIYAAIALSISETVKLVDDTFAGKNVIDVYNGILMSISERARFGARNDFRGKHIVKHIAEITQEQIDIELNTEASDMVYDITGVSENEPVDEPYIMVSSTSESIPGQVETQAYCSHGEGMIGDGTIEDEPISDTLTASITHLKQKYIQIYSGGSSLDD